MLPTTVLPIAAALAARLWPGQVAAWDTNISSINYTTVTGYFLQDVPGTDPSTFDFTKTNFGLINRTYDSDCDQTKGQTQWQRFANQVETLQREAPHNVEYKVLFMGRHGDGLHNDAQAYYGTPAWNCYYSVLNGNATTTWADAHLSTLGQQQALAVNNFWASEITNQKIPTPQTFYTSPLTRCLATANISFSGLDLAHPFVPTVKELFREGISGHTCDRRSNASYIRANFPSYVIEPGFTEDDELWEPLHGETDKDQTIRSRTVLDDVFSHDDSRYISITSHSGEIASILGVLGHQPFSLNTGAVIPVLVKATWKQYTPPSATEPYVGICTCTSPPAVSATSSQCVTATATVAPPGGGPN